MHVIKILACMILGQIETWKILQNKNILTKRKTG